MNRPHRGGPRIVLVGPPATGKTTLGEMLAARLQRPFLDLDAVGGHYYAEAGWSIAKLIERITAVGRLAAEIEWEPARAHAVARVIADHPDAMIALGAGHTSYTNPGLREAVRTVLENCPDVVHILPSADRDLSLFMLRERCIASKGHPWIADGHDFLAAWLDDPTPGQVATRTVYTVNQTPNQTVESLLPAV
jgi:nucleoside-triphosphatase THEP1